MNLTTKNKEKNGGAILHGRKNVVKEEIAPTHPLVTIRNLHESFLAKNSTFSKIVSKASSISMNWRQRVENPFSVSRFSKCTFFSASMEGFYLSFLGANKDLFLNGRNISIKGKFPTMIIKLGGCRQYLNDYFGIGKNIFLIIQEFWLSTYNCYIGVDEEAILFASYLHIGGI